MNIFKKIQTYRFLNDNQSQIQGLKLKHSYDKPVKGAYQYKLTGKINNKNISALKTFLLADRPEYEKFYVYISEQEYKKNPEYIEGLFAKKIFDIMMTKYQKQYGHKK